MSNLEERLEDMLKNVAIESATQIHNREHHNTKGDK